MFVYDAPKALQTQFCLTIRVFQTFQTLCFSKLIVNCLGQRTANLYAPTTRAYIVDGLLLIFSSRHHHAVKLPFYFFWCSSLPIFSLCTFWKLAWHFTISWIFNGWSRGHTFFNHHIEFCPHHFCILPFLCYTSNFLALFSSAMCTFIF